MAQQRGFSTAAKLHPSIVPHLHKQSRSIPIKSFTTLATIAVAGYAAKTYVDRALEKSYTRNTYENESEIAMRERNERLLDMYGDRSSLEELEKAIQHYEKR